MTSVLTLVPGQPALFTDYATRWELESIVQELRAARERWRSSHQRSSGFSTREFPCMSTLSNITDSLCGVLFPMRLGPPALRQESEDFYIGYTLEMALDRLFQQVRLELRYQRRCNGEDLIGVDEKVATIVQVFSRQLPELRSILDADVEAAYLGDPAAASVDEVLLCYPGILAVIYYRIAHALYRLGAPLIARMISEIAHSKTAIDIHPGAQIGAGFFIDHGTGVVIGETTIIGQRVRLYQAVTLGAKRFTQDANGMLEKGNCRHPILEDDVVIYAGATILGRITIGKGSSIGGNVWLTHSVPPNSQVTQANLRQELADTLISI